MGDLSETSMTNTHPGVAQAATKNAGSVTLGAVRVRRMRMLMPGPRSQRRLTSRREGRVRGSTNYHIKIKD